jgi:cell division protein YceG involved in septum cleavage
MISPAATTAATTDTSGTSIETTSQSSPATSEIIGDIEVVGGDMLERDIIPQLCAVFSTTEANIRNNLAADIPSFLIGKNLIGFRRLEGIIPPGRYVIMANCSLSGLIKFWITTAEARYNRLLTQTTDPNQLEPAGQNILASMVEAECLAGKHQEEVATVFLNRLDLHGKMQSCVTAEYALGYQRPYLTKTDINVQSEYNTYWVKALPAGPICCASDASLQASMKRKMDSTIYFFYYDYVLNDMFFFTDYSEFQQACTQSRQLFTANSKIGMRDKIDKQIVYGRPQSESLPVLTVTG